MHWIRGPLWGPGRLNSCVLQRGVSIGVAVYPETAAGADTLVQSADKSMYQMKDLHYQAASVTRWTAHAHDATIAPGPAPHCCFPVCRSLDGSSAAYVSSAAHGWSTYPAGTRGCARCAARSRDRRSGRSHRRGTHVRRAATSPLSRSVRGQPRRRFRCRTRGHLSRDCTKSKNVSAQQ